MSGHKGYKCVNNIVSLKDFLKTGRLGTMQIGITSAEVIAMLGSPDEIGESRKSLVYKYGSIEFHFDKTTSKESNMFYIEAPLDDNKFQLPSAWSLNDWELFPFMPLSDVESYLQSNEIHYNFDHPELVTQLKIVGSKVKITFDDELRLFSISIFDFK